MNNCDKPKILRRGNKTILIAYDPDGVIARRIADQIYFKTQVDQAKEDLRNNPIPDRITFPILEKMRQDREKMMNKTNKKGVE